MHVLRRSPVREERHDEHARGRSDEDLRLVPAPAQRPQPPEGERPRREGEPASGGDEVAQIGEGVADRLPRGGAPEGEGFRRAPGERERPGGADDRRHDERRDEKDGRAARAPLRAHGMSRRDRDEERERRDPERRERGEAKRRAEQRARRQGLARGVRQRGEGAADRGERSELRQRLVRVHDEADRAQEQEHRGRAVHAAIFIGLCPVARREIDERERREHERAARKARGGVELHQPLQRQAEAEREPVVERWIEEPRHAGDARHQRRAARRHVVHDAKADGVVRLPEIVAGEAGKRERQRDQRQRARTGR